MVVIEAWLLFLLNVGIVSEHLEMVGVVTLREPISLISLGDGFRLWVAVFLGIVILLVTGGGILLVLFDLLSLGFRYLCAHNSTQCGSPAQAFAVRIPWMRRTPLAATSVHLIAVRFRPDSP